MRSSVTKSLCLWLILLAGPAAGEQTTTLTLEGRQLHVLIHGDEFHLSRSELLRWVERSARVVAAYYGRFPARETYIAIRAMPGVGVRGQAFGWATPTVNIQLGLQTGRRKLDDDWVLIHELVHLAFPSVPEQQNWLEEGLAVYIEGVARAEMGEMTPAQVWGGFVRGMPHGLPQSDDKGLDHTPTWGRTYWGGALFCLLADIEIRQQTAGRKTLRDALRAIVGKGWNITNKMELLPVLAVADRALGRPVLRSLYNEMKDKPAPIDLAGLWDELGVVLNGRQVQFNDKAPLAAIRAAITERKSF